MKKIILLVVISFLMHFTLFSEENMIVQIENTKIAVPLGWLAQYTKTPQLFILYSPIEENDTFQENCNLIVEALPTEYSLAQYISEGTKALQSVYEEFTIIKSGQNYHIFTGYLNNNFLKQMQFFYIKGKVAYILTFTSTPDNFDRYVDVFNSIAATFTLE